MFIQLNILIRDNEGVYHKPGERGEVVGQRHDLATSRELTYVRFGAGHKVIVMPQEYAVVSE
jgi:hypothetical protein